MMPLLNEEVSVMRTRVSCTLRLEGEIYSRIKDITKGRHTSFTAFVQGALADVLKNEEQKALYDAFSQAGEYADVDFAMSAQQEVVARHE
jgi:predicted transcriptional regulator